MKGMQGWSTGKYRIPCNGWGSLSGVHGLSREHRKLIIDGISMKVEHRLNMFIDGHDLRSFGVDTPAGGVTHSASVGRQSVDS